MSLDIYLIERNKEGECECCGSTIIGDETVFETNITHNLGTMADKAKIYEALWRPEEIDADLAKDIAPIIAKGLGDMKKRPEYYKQFDADNGWGTYDQFVPWIDNYLEACLGNPTAEIVISQ